MDPLKNGWWYYGIFWSYVYPFFIVSIWSLDVYRLFQPFVGRRPIEERTGLVSLVSNRDQCKECITKSCSGEGGERVANTMWVLHEGYAKKSTSTSWTWCLRTEVCNCWEILSAICSYRPPELPYKCDCQIGSSEFCIKWNRKGPKFCNFLRKDCSVSVNKDDTPLYLWLRKLLCPGFSGLLCFLPTKIEFTQIHRCWIQLLCYALYHSKWCTL